VHFDRDGTAHRHDGQHMCAETPAVALRLVQRHGVFLFYTVRDGDDSPPMSQPSSTQPSSSSDSVGSRIIRRGSLLGSRPEEGQSSQWPTELRNWWIFEVATNVRENATDVQGYWLRRGPDGRYTRSHSARRWIPLPMATLDTSGRHRLALLEGIDFVRSAGRQRTTVFQMIGGAGVDM
jgi:hypothetical protein